MEDVAFDPAADGVVLASSSVALRQLGFATQRVQLLSVADEGENVIARYTFNHSPS